MTHTPEQNIQETILGTGAERGVRDFLMQKVPEAGRKIGALLREEGINPQPIESTLAEGMEADYERLETLRKTHLDFSEVIESIIEASELHRTVTQLSQEIIQLEQRKAELQETLQREREHLQKLSTRETGLTTALTQLSHELQQLNQTIQRITEERAQKVGEQQEKNKRADQLLTTIVHETLSTAPQLSPTDRVILEDYIQKRKGAENKLAALAQRSAVVKQLVTLKFHDAARDASDLVHSKYGPLLHNLENTVHDLDARLQETQQQKDKNSTAENEGKKELKTVQTHQTEGQQREAQGNKKLTAIGSDIEQKRALVEQQEKKTEARREVLRGGIGYQLTDMQQKKLENLFRTTKPEQATECLRSLFDMLHEANVPEGAIVTLRIPVAVSFSFQETTLQNKAVLSKIQWALEERSKPHMEAYHPQHMEAYLRSEAERAPGGMAHAMLMTGEAREWHITRAGDITPIPFAQCSYVWYETR